MKCEPSAPTGQVFFLGASRWTELPLPRERKLIGYGDRTSPAEGQLDSLEACCIYIRELPSSTNARPARIAVISLDLLGLSVEQTDELARAIAGRAGLDFDEVLISCTHTHAGPPAVPVLGHPQPEREWVARLEETLVRLVMEVVENPELVELLHGRSTCNVTENRVAARMGDIDGAGASVDPAVDAVIMRSVPDLRVKGVIATFACHPVCLRSDNLYYSADFVHFLREDVRTAVGLPLPVCFVNGCCGDIRPRDRAGLESAQRVGSEIAASITRLLSLADQDGGNDCEDRSGGRILHRHLGVSLDFGESRVSRHRPAAKTIDTFKEEQWRHELQVRFSHGIPGSVSVRIFVCRIGKIILVGLPFEAFSLTGMHLKEQLGVDATIVTAFAGGDVGYIAPDSMRESATYEVEQAYRYYLYPKPFAAGSEATIRKELELHGRRLRERSAAYNKS